MATLEPEAQVSGTGTGPLAPDAPLPPDTPRVAGVGPSRPWVPRSGRDRRATVRLRLLDDEGVVVIDDRRLPGGRATIDMIAVGPAGVFVIETRKSKGLVHTKRRGPVSDLGPDELHVGRRNCMDWVADVARRTEVIRTALDSQAWACEVPVQGMLCLTRAAWGFATPIEVGGVWVGWPRLVAERLRQPDLLDSPLVNEVSGLISEALR
jgi:Nuclease-related domain